MKKKKIYYLLLLLVLALTPNVVHAEKYIVCNGDSKFPYSVMAVVALLIQLFKIVVPIMLIIMGSITFAKAVLSSDIDKNLKQAVTIFIKKCISAIAVFFIVTIVSLVINSLPDSEDSKNCIKCVIDPAECQTVEVDESYKKPEIPQGSGDGTETIVTNPVLYSSSTSSTTGSGVMNIVNTQTFLNTDPHAGTTISSGNSYKLYVPKSISASKPLIVFFPGMQGTSDQTRIYNAVSAGTYDAYILMLSSSSSPATAITTIQNVISTYGLNSSNVSAWGYSLGAEKVQGMIKNNTFTFKNAIIISTDDTKVNSNYKNMSIYVITSTGDVWRQKTKSFYLNNTSSKMEYKEYSLVDHGGLISSFASEVGTWINWSLTH